jgi:hypothetical protein
MRLCLAVHFQNEAPWLRLHLPVLLQSKAIDGLLGVDALSHDYSAQIIEDLGGSLYSHPFVFGKNGEHQNFMINMVEAEGYDAILHVDPDELLFPGDIDHIKEILAVYKAVKFPTYNFVGDRDHYCPFTPYYPDPHLRAWRLGCGVHYDLYEHSQADVSLTGWEAGQDICYVSSIHLYHYGDIKPWEARNLLALNRLRGAEGLPPLEALPPDYVIGQPPPCVRFAGQQPLDPRLIGARTPVSEED